MEERESSFTEEISFVKISNHVKIPYKDMCRYNSTGDSDDHIDTYLDWMNMQGASDMLKGKIFPLTLMRDARTWINHKKRCDFYKDHGHKTKNCFNLKEQGEELIRGGKL
ncbi:hypothetical protein ACOSQ3_023705 [Xanthoceras sorbifolium]